MNFGKLFLIIIIIIIIIIITVIGFIKRYLRIVQER